MALTPASLLAVHFFPEASRTSPPYCRMVVLKYHIVQVEECMAKSKPSRTILLPFIFTSFFPMRPTSSQVRG